MLYSNGTNSHIEWIQMRYNQISHVNAYQAQNQLDSKTIAILLLNQLLLTDTNVHWNKVVCSFTNHVAMILQRLRP